MIAALVACAAPDAAPTPAPDAVATTVTTPEGVPWVVETTEPAPIDLPAALAALQEGVQLAAELSPVPVLDVYRDLVVGADPGCPSWYESDGLDYWLDDCTAGTGTAFDGFAVDDVEVTPGPYGDTVVATAGGAARIEDASGTWIELDGIAQEVASEEAPGLVASTLLLTGRFSTNHPIAAGSWLERGLRPNLVATTYDVYGTRAAFAVVGAVDDLGGDYPAVAFDDAILLDDGLGYGGCAVEPTGVVSVRLADGSWLDVVFDPVFSDDVVSVDPALCDGCGAAWHRDAPQGDACLDFSSWL